MRCRSLLLALLLLAVPCTALGGLPQGAFTLDAVIQDNSGPWLVRFIFAVSESGAVTQAKIQYPNDPCRVTVSGYKLSENSVIFQEAVVKGAEVCAPSRYTLTYNPAGDWAGTPWTAVRCELEGKQYAGSFRKQVFAAGGVSDFYAKNGASSWEELAQKRDWETLIVFYDKVKSTHREEALAILQEMGREDPTGKRARELTRRCTFDGEWDYLQSALTSRADYGFLVEVVDDAPDKYVGWALRLALESALREGPDGYTRFLTDKSLLRYWRSSLVARYAIEKGDRAELEALAANPNVYIDGKREILAALYPMYTADGEAGYRRFVEKYPLSPQAGEARKEITRFNVAALMTATSPDVIEQLVLADPHVLDADGAHSQVVKVLRAQASSGWVEAFSRRIDDGKLRSRLRELQQDLQDKERAQQIELALANKDIPALRRFVSGSLGEGVRNRAEAVLYESARKTNTVQGYEEFLGYARGNGVRDKAVAAIYALVPQTPADQVDFARKYPGNPQAAGIWKTMYEQAAASGFFSSANPERVEAFLKLNPPSEYVQKCMKALGADVLDGGRKEQLAFIAKYPGSPYCETIRKKIAQECKGSDIADMTWFVAVFQGTPEAEEVGAAMAQAVYDQSVTSQDTVGAYNNFCTVFAGVAPKDLLQKAYDRAMSLHRKWLEKQLDDAHGVFTSELAENENYEKIARKLFHAADKCEESGDMLGARQLYQLIDGSEILSQTQTSFDNLRDKKMRRFLSGQFADLIKAQDRGAQMLARELKLVSSTVERSKLTREDFKQFNEDRMWAGRTFRNSVGEY